ncbi:MAG TPA: cyclic nucleotide-binding domain-containing protein [Kofleriaceae bacterium]|nr:cyclic nucleotide-binding domain-containing protein [Kofleriaceae bacterium]
MAKKDARALREEAQAAASAGKHKRAVEAYGELERLEPQDPQWPKRAGDMWRKLGKDGEAIAAYDRAVDRYAQSGFVVQAIAMCRLILQIDPDHGETARRLADMTEQQEAGRTRIGALAAQQAQVTDDDLVVADARSKRASPPPPQVPGNDDLLDLEPIRAVPKATPQRSMPPAPTPREVIAEISLEPSEELALDVNLDSVIPSARVQAAQIAKPQPPPIAKRTRTPSAPIGLAPGAPLDTVRLGRIAPGALERTLPDGSLTGISVIPLEALEEEVLELEPEPEDPVEELSMEDVAEVVEAGAEAFAELAQPRAWSNAARKALAQTPLFSGLDHDALEALMTKIGLVNLESGQVLFREGEPGDTLYIVAEGEVGVAHEGPPRVAIARLGPGSFFGEVALVTDQARTATVEAITPTLLLAIDRALVSTLVADHPKVLFVILRFVRDRLLARLLDTNPMFAPLAPSDRTPLAARFRFLEIEPGSVVVDEGKKADGLYVFLAGRADARKGRELVRYLGAGDVAGEASILHGSPSPIRVAAITKCLALQLATADFREIIMTHPHVLEYVGTLAERDLDDGPAFQLDLI